MVTFDEIKKMGKKWAAEYCKALNNTPEYEEAAKGWGVDFEGAMLFIMTPSGEITFDVVSFLDLKDGKCLGIKLLEPGEAPPRTPGLTLKAPMLTWKKLAFKEQNPVQALMTGELQLEGDMDLAMKYSQAAMLLADVTEKTDRSLFTSFDLGE
ncbi:MAG: SCP2 sterol-binding domain-containing protein [Candidatus Freyarchaeum deiterrae]